MPFGVLNLNPGRSSLARLASWTTALDHTCRRQGGNNISSEAASSSPCHILPCTMSDYFHIELVRLQVAACFEQKCILAYGGCSNPQPHELAEVGAPGPAPNVVVACCLRVTGKPNILQLRIMPEIILGTSNDII